MTRIILVQPMLEETYGAIIDGVPENERVASALESVGLDPTDTERILAELSGPGLTALEVAEKANDASADESDPG